MGLACDDLSTRRGVGWGFHPQPCLAPTFDLWALSALPMSAPPRRHPNCQRPARTDLHGGSSPGPRAGVGAEAKSDEAWRGGRAPVHCGSASTADGVGRRAGLAEHYWNENEIKAALSEIANFFIK